MRSSGSSGASLLLLFPLFVALGSMLKSSTGRPSSSWYSRPSRPSGAPPGWPFQRNGQNTTGYSSPLDLWMVMICTRLRSDSRRSCAASSPLRSARCVCSQRSCSSGEACVSDAWCRPSDRCSRLVSRRSPSARASIRAATPSRTIRLRSITPTPRRSHCSRYSVNRVTKPSSWPSWADAASIAAASKPSITVDSAARSMRSRAGSRTAASTRSRSSASVLWKTLACESSTLPTPSAASAWRIAPPWAWLRTSTAMSPPASGLPPCRISPRCAPLISRATSPAQASAAARCAARLFAGRPSAAGGSCQSCSGERGCVVSCHVLRGFWPQPTGW